MKHFLLYGHGGSYNHGAEAITSTTIKIIRDNYPDAKISLSTHFVAQDIEFNIDADDFFESDADIWALEKNAKSIDDKKHLAKLMYRNALESINKDTILLSVGGDNFCYPNWHRLTVFQEKAFQMGAKSILWGCSVEPSEITDEMINVLNSYTQILCRESFTYKALLKCLGTDIQLLLDPAFLLNPAHVKLPYNFQRNNFIGINLSPLVVRREVISGILIRNIIKTIKYILSETNMNIALIPHVVMPVDNDYLILSDIYSAIPEHMRSRIWLVGDKYSAAEYKFIISQCKLLICSRTHASIAAYSSGVPAIVLGYSVKSIGVAYDLKTSDFIVDISKINTDNIVLDLFVNLSSNSNFETCNTINLNANYIKIICNL